MSRLSQSVAVGVGSAGALVDVSASANLGEGVEYEYGRGTEFDDTDAGEFSFVLDNADGRFTPDNETAAVAAGFAQSLVEGAAVCWQLGSRLVAGRVVGVAPEFPDDEVAWGLVRVTCQDATGDLARSSADSLAEGIVEGINPVGVWLLNDNAGSGSAFGSGLASVAPLQAGGNVTFGIEGFAGGPSQQAELSIAAGSTVTYYSEDGLPRTGIGNYYKPPGVSSSYAITGFGFVVTPLNGSTFFEVATDWMSQFRVGIQNTNLVWYNPVATAYETIMPITVGEPMAVWIGQSGSTMQIYVNGALMDTEAGAFIFSQQAPYVTIGNAAYGDSLVRLSMLVGVNTPFNLGAGYLTVEDRLAALSLMTGTTVVSDGDLWPAMLGGSYAGSGLDMLNDLARTEQGYVYAETSGTLTSPTSQVVLRARTRPTTVTTSFDVEDELDGAPELVRDLTNLVTSVRVQGTDADAIVSDASLVDQVGTKNTTETTMLSEVDDLTLWGQDRLIRGVTVGVRVAVATVDAMTTPTDRSADLLALRPGDRVRFTGLPDDVLGFDEWDGWFLGAEEQHTLEEHIFDLKFQPVLDPVPVFNGARFAAGESLQLSGGINSSVTSISVASTDGETFTTDAADLPVDIVIDSEEMTVTAVTSATPQVFTVTRGVNGTTAASHADEAVVELAGIEPAADAGVVTNHFLNPLFNGASQPVNQSNATASIDTYLGSSMAKAVATSTGSASMRLMPNVDRWAVTEGQFVYAAFNGYNAAAGSRNFQAVMRFYDTAGATLGTQLSATSGGIVAIGASGSATMSVSATAPSGTQSMSVAFQRDATGSVGDTFYADAVVVSDQVVSAFAGSSTSTSTVMYSWAGEPDASESYKVTQGQVQPATFGF